MTSRKHRSVESQFCELPPPRRIIWCLGALLCLFVLLMGRLVYLQSLQGPKISQNLESNMSGQRKVARRRGRILDRRGRELAVSLRGAGVAMDPARVPDPALTLESLAGVLDLSSEEQEKLLQRLHRFQVRGRTCRFLWLRHHVGEETARVIRSLRIPGVVLTPIWERHYPQGETGCHVIGFTSRDGQGLEGMERILQKDLESRPDHLAVRRDARRRLLVPIRANARQGAGGWDAALTLDAYIQRVAEQELARIQEKYRPRASCAIVMDPFSGDILALANMPGFDLNDARATDPAVRLNPAVAAVFEPGSVFKPFIAAAALEAGRVKPQDSIYCEQGAWNLGYRVLHDSHGYGHLSVIGVIEKSSNVGIAKIAAKLGPENLYRALQDFSFGRKTGIDLAGELPGLLKPVKKWNVKFAMTSIPMGQEVAVTPLQLATGYSVLANGGILVRPRLWLESKDEKGRIYRQSAVDPIRRVISEKTSRVVCDMLARVVKTGTGRRARCEDYPIGGKTGTAQIAGPGGYQEGKYTATFCGIAPIASPKLVTIVAVQEPQGAYYGGVVSAPAVKSIMRQSLTYLGVPPADKSTTVAMTGDRP